MTNTQDTRKAEALRIRMLAHRAEHRGNWGVASLMEDYAAKILDGTAPVRA